MHCHSHDSSYTCCHRISRCVSVSNTDLLSHICFRYGRRYGSSTKPDDSVCPDPVTASESADDALLAAGSGFSHSTTSFYRQWASF
uniref:Uncharacterized protein n=1 Tax=Coptotermes formosanus TaxID=36987 RepID=R4UNX2_COPFO|nr:hypothetical protein [Coptotermes formosanus]